MAPRYLPKTNCRKPHDSYGYQHCRKRTKGLYYEVACNYAQVLVHAHSFHPFKTHVNYFYTLHLILQAYISTLYNIFYFFLKSFEMFSAVRCRYRPIQCCRPSQQRRGWAPDGQPMWPPRAAARAGRARPAWSAAEHRSLGTRASWSGPLPSTEA